MISQAELELQHLRWPRRSVSQVGPAAYAAFSRSLVAGSVQGICICPAPPVPLSSPYYSSRVERGPGLGLRPGATTGDSEFNAGGLGGSDARGHRRPPYVTPVLMVLFDNGSVQCFTSPAHISALEKDIARDAAAAVDSKNAAAVETASPSAAASVGPVSPTPGSAEGGSGAQPTPHPCSTPSRSTRRSETDGGERASAVRERSAAAVAATAVTMAAAAATRDGQDHGELNTIGSGSRSAGPFKASLNAAAVALRPRLWQGPPFLGSSSAVSSGAQGARLPRRAARAGAGQGRSGVGGGGTSSGHDSTSDDDVFVSFRSQVSWLWVSKCCHLLVLCRMKLGLFRTVMLVHV